MCAAVVKLEQQMKTDPYGNWFFGLTRDLVSVMRERFRAGEPAKSIADDYDCPLTLVELLVDDLNAVD